MVAMEPNPTWFQFAAWKLGKAMDRSIDKKVTRVRTSAQTTIRLMLHIVGFSCLTIAGFTASITAGWIVAGFSSLVLSWLMTNTRTAEPDQTDPQRPMQTR
jgi:hypothetical protein